MSLIMSLITLKVNFTKKLLTHHIKHHVRVSKYQQSYNVKNITSSMSNVKDADPKMSKKSDNLTTLFLKGQILFSDHRNVIPLQLTIKNNYTYHHTST